MSFFFLLRRRVTYGILAALLTAFCNAALTQTSTQVAVDIGALKKVPFEELFDIEITTLARRPEGLVDAASAIQVITSEDIRRSGASSLREALRLASNLHVAKINFYNWAISARGFPTNSLS